MAKKPEREKTTKWQKVLIGKKWQKSLKTTVAKKFRNTEPPKGLR
jgi:hypothetical protein